MLAYPNPNLPYTLYTDASDTWIGACQTQKINESSDIEKPIYFISHKLSTTQIKWAVIEKECYAIHYALQKLDLYLHGANFIIKTDHKPLKYLLDSPIQNKKIQLWALGISGYNCKIEYIAGETNYCADLLSRTPHRDEANETDEENISPYINDNVYEINTINYNAFNLKTFVSCEVEEADLSNKETFTNNDVSSRKSRQQMRKFVKLKSKLNQTLHVLIFKASSLLLMTLFIIFQN